MYLTGSILPLLPALVNFLQLVPDDHTGRHRLGLLDCLDGDWLVFENKFILTFFFKNISREKVFIQASVTFKNNRIIFQKFQASLSKTLRQVRSPFYN